MLNPYRCCVCDRPSPFPVALPVFHRCDDVEFEHVVELCCATCGPWLWKIYLRHGLGQVEARP